MLKSIELDTGLISRIQNLADLRQCSTDAIMETAISDYIDRAEARESFQQTGKHLTGAEVQDWLASWGSEAEMQIPQCHV